MQKICKNSAFTYINKITKNLHSKNFIKILHAKTKEIKILIKILMKFFRLAYLSLTKFETMPL